MADQDNNGTNPGPVNQGRQQQKKPPNIPKCPICGTRPVAKEQQACLVCCPIYRIDPKLTRGASQWELLIETYENNIQKNVSFVVDIPGQKLIIVKFDQKKYWKEPGLAVIPVKVSAKARTIGFGVLGGPARVDNIEIPPEKSESFHWTPSDKGKGFWHNLLKGLKG